MSPVSHASKGALFDLIKSRLSPLAWAGAALAALFGFGFAAYFAVFSFLLDLPFLLGVSVFGAIATVPLFPRRGWPVRALFAASSLLVLALFFDRPAQELDAKVDALATVSRTQGPQAWSQSERYGLQMLSRTMARAGFLMGYVEVAREHAGMHEDGPALREFHSVFPVASPTLVDFVCRETVKERHILFREADGRRYGLAFNGGRVKKRVNKLSNDIELNIAIRYLDDSRSHLFTARGLLGGKHAFVLDEGVYNGLEQLGLLHRYTARWHWRVPHSFCRAQRAHA